MDQITINTYTWEELYSVYKLLKSKGYRRLRRSFFGINKIPRGDDLKEILTRKNTVDRSRADLLVLDPSIYVHETRGLTSQDYVWLMYREPLDRVPLYLNTRHLKILAAWRLERGI